LANSRRAGWSAGEINALNRLGLLHNATGRPQLAGRCLRQALDQSIRTDHALLQVSCLVNLGLVALHVGALQQAVEYYTRSIQPAEPGHTVTAMALTGLGCAWGCLGHFDRATDHLVRALALHRATGGRHGEAMTLRNLAETHLDAGRPRQAREFADAALAIAHDAADLRNKVAALNILGAIHRAEEDPATAAGHHRQALELTAGASHDHHHTDALIGLAASLLALGHVEQARPYAEQALAVSRQVGHRILHGRALAVLAGIHLALGDQARAADFARQAIAVHRDNGYRIEQARALVLLGHAVDDPTPHWRQAAEIFTTLGIPQAATSLPGQ